MKNRRDVLKTSAVLGGALGAGLVSISSLASTAVVTAPKPLRILILGSTGFIGPGRCRQAALRAGIKSEREKEVLAAWHAKQRS